MACRATSFSTGAKNTLKYELMWCGYSKNTFFAIHASTIVGFPSHHGSEEYNFWTEAQNQLSLDSHLIMVRTS
jgi:hypothetical protein